jgi:spermidine/putrescine transport system substrate-binding protein
MFRGLLFPVLAIALTLSACSPSEKTLHLFNWDNYMNPEVLADFQKEFGVRVVEDKFASNEDMIAKLQAGASGYDVVVPSDYAVRLLARQNLLARLDHASLPNLRNLAPSFRNPSYDATHEYSVPYLWGATGIGYSKKALAAAAPASWDDLFNPQKLKRAKGRVSMLNDMREVIGAALIYKGFAPNSTNPSELEAAKKVLLAQKSFLAKFDSEGYEDSLVAGETVLAHGWSGEIFTAQKDNPDIGFMIPKEGAVVFVDTLVVPRSSKNKAMAEAFINYLLRPEVAAKISNFLSYPTPNAAAKPLIDPKLEGANFQLPSGVRFHSIEDLDDQVGKLYEDAWTEVKVR